MRASAGASPVCRRTRQRMQLRRLAGVSRAEPVPARACQGARQREAPCGVVCKADHSVRSGAQSSLAAGVLPFVIDAGSSYPPLASCEQPVAVPASHQATHLARPWTACSRRPASCAYR